MVSPWDAVYGVTDEHDGAVELVRLLRDEADEASQERPLDIRTVRVLSLKEVLDDDLQEMAYHRIAQLKQRINYWCC